MINNSVIKGLNVVSCRLLTSDTHRGSSECFKMATTVPAKLLIRLLIIIDTRIGNCEIKVSAIKNV